MAEITCTRCKNSAEQLPSPPLPRDLGVKIRAEICRNCWQEWLQHQTALINHHALNLLDPEAKRFLTVQTEAYLFGPVSDQPGTVSG